MNEHILANGTKLELALHSYEEGNFGTEAGIYIIVNTKNSKAYVGQSTNLKTRIYKHFYCFNNKTHYNIHFQRAYNKDGQHFKIGILEHINLSNCSNADALLSERESYYMAKFETLNQANGYNRAIPPDSQLIAFQKRKYRTEYTTPEDVVLQVCELLNEGKTRVEVSKIMGLNEPVISGITSGANHSDLTCKLLNKEILAQWKYNLHKTGLSKEEMMFYKMDKARPSTSKLDKDMVIKICNLMNKGFGDTDISRIVNVPSGSINNIRRGKNWSDISLFHLKHEILKDRVFNREDLLKVGFSKGEVNKVIYKRFSKLTDEDIHDICKDIVSGKMKVTDIARKYNIDSKTVRNIVNQKTHTDISQNYFAGTDIKTKVTPHLSIREAEEIWELFLSGKSKKEISEITGVNIVKIRRIINGSCYKEAYEKYSKIEQA